LRNGLRVFWKTSVGSDYRMNKDSLKVIDVFSGVGGLTLGAARAGLSVLAAVETDRHAVSAHKLNFPNVVHISEDASRLSAARLLSLAGHRANEPLAIIGGPPCQGFSNIGHRNPDDPRNQLFVSFFRLIRDIQPVFYLAENVPGIMDADNEELRETALNLIRDDYEILPAIRLSAKDFGCPTTRTRYLFVGYKSTYFDSIRSADFRAGAVRVNVREALLGLPRRILPHWQSEKQSWRKVEYPDNRSRFWTSVKSKVPRGIGDPSSIRRLVEDSLVSGFLGTAHTQDVVRRFASVRPGKQDAVSKARRLEWDGYCPTLRAGTGSDRGSYQAVRPIHPSAHRVITPREAARLQGFPDWFQFSPTKWHSFRQIGNSVCPIFAEEVFRRILRKRK